MLKPCKLLALSIVFNVQEDLKTISKDIVEEIISSGATYEHAHTFGDIRREYASTKKLRQNDLNPMRSLTHVGCRQMSSRQMWSHRLPAARNLR